MPKCLWKMLFATLKKGNSRHPIDIIIYVYVLYIWYIYMYIFIQQITVLFHFGVIIYLAFFFLPFESSLALPHWLRIFQDWLLQICIRNAWSRRRGKGRVFHSNQRSRPAILCQSTKRYLDYANRAVLDERPHSATFNIFDAAWRKFGKQSWQAGWRLRSQPCWIAVCTSIESVHERTKHQGSTGVDIIIEKDSPNLHLLPPVRSWIVQGVGWTRYWRVW